MTPDFTKGEESIIKDLAREIIPDEQEKCSAFRIFQKEKNVDKLFDGFTTMENLVKELKEHKLSHAKVEIEITKLRKYRWTNKIYSFFGAMLGGFIAMITKDKIEGR